MVGRWNVLLKGPLFGDMSILGKVPVKKEHFPLPWLWEIFPRWNHSNTSSNQTGILRVFWWKEWGVPEIFLEQPPQNSSEPVFFWNLHVPLWTHHTCHDCFVLPSILVASPDPLTDRHSDVFNPFDNQSSNWIISRGRREHIWNQPIFLLGGQKSLVIGPTRRALEAARNSETSSKCFIALREATPLI